MKTNCWLILGMMMATSVLAQNNTNALPPIPAPLIAPPAPAAPAASAPAVEPVKKPAPVKHKKHAAASKKFAFIEPTVALVPGTAEVMVSNLNVRGQAGLQGEVVAHLVKGEVVTVLSQINLDKHAAGEPAQWAKIALPASTKTWVNTKFIDATNNTVLSKKLNLRAGPGENYSVLGTIEQGTAVTQLTTKGAWTQIEPPTNAYAFVSAAYLKQEPVAALATTTPAPDVSPVPAPTPTPVVESQPILTEPASVPAPPAPPVVDTNLPPPPRIVSHEGVVGHVDSVIAPTAYVLYDPSTQKEINFLYTNSKNLDIGRYTNMRIVVTGEEALADRWNETPLLTIERIVVLETNAVPKAYYPSPRQRH
jgi:SH3-like domain-containing protein